MTILIILATIISSIFGGLFAIRFRDKLHLILGFSAGAVLGVTLFDLIPESLLLAGEAENVMVMAALGFSFYLILDRFFSIHCEDPHECKNQSHKFNVAPFALTFHSILDGLGIGLAFKISATVGWIVAVAVLAHKFSDGINIVAVTLKNKGEKKSFYPWLIANALAPGVGFILSFFINISEFTLGLSLAFFVGLFLYISASDLIPESHHHHPTAATTFSTLLGLLLMYLVVKIAA